jgi:hypothetical protein
MPYCQAREKQLSGRKEALCFQHGHVYETEAETVRFVTESLPPAAASRQAEKGEY